MATRDKDGVYWMNVHDAAAQFRRYGLQWQVQDVLTAIETGHIHAAKEQRISGVRWRISSTEIERVVKAEREGLIEHVLGDA